MKKLRPISIITLLVALSFGSCTKSTDDPTGNYTCKCSYTLSGVNDQVSVSYTNERKSVSQTACDDEKSQLTAQGAINVSCTLN